MSWLEDLLEWLRERNPPETTTTSSPPPPSEPDIRKLENYLFENSDSYPGKSYVMLPPGMKAESVKVNGHVFVYRMDYRGTRQTYYGPTVDTFSYPATVTVEDRQGVKWVDKVLVMPPSPAPPPTPPTPRPPTPPPPDGRGEVCRYHGRYNGDRPTWYASKRMNQYPRSFTVQIDGCITHKVRNNNGHRYTYGGLIVKQSDVSGRGMAIIYSSSCHSRKCRLIFN